MATYKKPVRIKPENKGKLRKALGAKKGQKIPLSKLRSAARSKNEKTRARAQFAINARGWGK